ncbi:MAG: hypothetical protein CMG64_00010 [Candidatus Marinimicrobia bacterium]|nr:hypothetical protein [Candidatus Neomarinimicrobiota bacterium]
MNIALVTNNKLHHKYWASQLYANNTDKVKLILIPDGEQSNFIKKTKEKKLLYYGYYYFLIKLKSILYNYFSKQSLINKISIAEKNYFLEHKINYESIPNDIIYNIKSVNCEFAINLIKKNKIDVVFFLGGDIARSSFINSVKICLNYHSGLSPFYNGNKTIFHAVSDFRPNFSGGTLMKMNERIDGGEILMHFFPSIRDDDRAEDLFMKSIIGSIKLYQTFIDMNTYNVDGIIQKKSFKYVRNIDWNFINDLKLISFYNHKRMQLYNRNSTVINYMNKNYSLKDLYSLCLEFVLR